ncbi:hypothetical protein SRHO_G00286580 [Serrasalmus rhombeus]
MYDIFPDLTQVKLRLSKLNFVTRVTRKTLGSHKEFVRILCKRRAELQEVPTVEECDVILAFCPVVSAAGIDTKNALQQLNDVSSNAQTDTHYSNRFADDCGDALKLLCSVLGLFWRCSSTFDPELIVPDSSRSVNREETLTVDCLFHEDKGLLQCMKCYKILPENVRQPWEQFENELLKRRRFLKEFPLDKCKVVLVFCPVVSRAETDVAAALDKLRETDKGTDATGKAAVLVVLHHTFDPEHAVSDSSRDVARPNTLTVDCLFHEDRRPAVQEE